jgi:type II secretory pathway pseudopilin PulG
MKSALFRLPSRQRGVSVISAIIILVILMSLAAAFLSFGKQANVDTAQEIQAARMEYLAQAAAEIAMYRSDPKGETAELPNCDAAGVQTVFEKVAENSGIGATLGVTCAVSADYDEGGKTIRVYDYSFRVGSTARTPPQMADRRIEIMFEKCREFSTDAATGNQTAVKADGSYDCADGA